MKELFKGVLLKNKILEKYLWRKLLLEYKDEWSFKHVNQEKVNFINGIFHGFCYKLSEEQLFNRTQTVGCFWSIETVSDLGDCVWECYKWFPRKVTFNGKTYKYMVNYWQDV